MAVSVQSLMCHIRGSNSLTCGSTNIELFCTWGTPEKLPPTVNSCQREAPSARRLVPIGARTERAAVFPPPTAGKPLDETHPNDATSGQEPKCHTRRKPERRTSHARSPSLRQTQGDRHEKAPCSSPARPRCWRAHRGLRRGKRCHLPNFPAGADAVRGHRNSGRPIFRYNLVNRDARPARSARGARRPRVCPRRDRVRWHHGRRMVLRHVRR